MEYAKKILDPRSALNATMLVFRAHWEQVTGGSRHQLCVSSVENLSSQTTRKIAAVPAQGALVRVKHETTHRQHRHGLLSLPDLSLSQAFLILDRKRHNWEPHVHA